MSRRICLPPELDEFVAEAVRSRRYRSVSEVVWAGLRLLQEQEQRLAQKLAEIEGTKNPDSNQNDVKAEAKRSR